MNPTRQQFDAYVKAFDYFNHELFDGKLPRCVLNFSRKAHSTGFFAADRWTHRENGESAHEISLNPDVLNLPPVECMQTLVHEMVHLWQREFGKPSRAGYHNAEWAAKMDTIGLMPSDTGQTNGKKTGQSMADYVVDGGPFDRAFRAMPDKALLPWLSGQSARPKSGTPRRDQLKYQCPECGIIVRGKAGLNLRCDDCNQPLREGGA
jgi:hypothetical protein